MTNRGVAESESRLDRVQDEFVLQTLRVRVPELIGTLGLVTDS